MKKCFFALFIFISICSFGQQLVRGYSAGYAYGLISYGDNFSFRHNNQNYIATPVDAQASSLHFSFPFDYGVNRHRINFLPGVDIQIANYYLETNPLMSGAGNDTLRLNFFTIIPQVGIMYKYHFYVGSVHCALGFGLDFKVPVSNSISLMNSNKYELMEYDYENPNFGNDGNDGILFTPGTLFEDMRDLGFHVNPKIGLDIYVTRYLVTNISIYASPLTGFTDTPAIRGFAGLGATYLMPVGKEDDSRLLQYYKK